MSNIAIRVDDLSKKYILRHANAERYTTLRDVIAYNAKTIGARLIGRGPQQSTSNSREEFFALKDVSFEVRQGERVGIIGRNGAGKSTLLKILSRITEPTKGRIEIEGRVSSLLEVGTGFHPELTGRENIFLNGAILGMTKAEIKRKFDEIVDFAEVEKFLDTPVKHFSSGMYVRLAFAVAAHLEPEILIVDEVLAVGDAQFQDKCLGKMEEAGKEGRTVLFVSHNLPMVLRLTQRALLLHEGELVANDLSPTVVQKYLCSEHLCPSSREWSNCDTAPGDDTARLLSVVVKNKNGKTSDTYDIRAPIYLEMTYMNLIDDSRVTAIFHLYDNSGTCIFANNDWNNKIWWNTHRKRGIVKVTCEIPGNFLAEGNFFVLAAIGSYNPNVVHALEQNVISFQVVDHSCGDGVRGEFAGSDWPGVIRPMLDWRVELLEKG
jgi:lipopolysaccharide transport system ATP-binding protein